MYAAVAKADAAVFAHMVVRTRPWLDAQTLKLNSEMSNAWKTSDTVSRANKQMMFRIQANNFPHQMNLHRWGQVKSARCTLCRKGDEGLIHMVAACD